MGFFNDFGKKTTEATSKITKETKLRLKMSDSKSKINNLYEEIGKKVYEKHVRNESIDIKKELNEECEKIDALAKEIEEARLEILKLNNKKICPNCNAEIEKDAAFCSKCGKKIEQVVEEVPKDVKEAEKVSEEIKEEIKEEKKETKKKEK